MTNSLVLLIPHTCIVTIKTVVSNGVTVETTVVCQKRQVHLTRKCVVLQKRSVIRENLKPKVYL